MRGTDLDDVDVRVTLVHELTHALQDQHFDLTKLDRGVETSGEDFALTALVEGDATSVEDDYLFSLPDDEQDAYFAEEPDDTVDSTDRAARPTSRPCSTCSSAGPYIFGSRYLEVLRDAGGVKRVNRAFAEPPTSEEQIIDPVAAQRGAGAEAGPGAEARPRREASRRRRRLRCAEHVPRARGAPRPEGRVDRGRGLGRRPLRRLQRSAATEPGVRPGRDPRATPPPTPGRSPTRSTSGSPPCPTVPRRCAVARRRVTLTACDVGGVTAPTEATLDAAVDLLVNRNDVALRVPRRPTRR